MTAISRTSAAWPLLAVMLSTACLTTERPAVTDTTRQAVGTVSLPSTGEWQNGDERVAFTTTVSDSVIEVTEAVTFGSDGTARRQYRIGASGALLSFQESRAQTAQASDKSPSRMQVEFSLTFAGDSAVARTKRVDGVDAPVRDYEVTAARTHVTELLSQFGASRTPPPSRL